MVMFIGVSDLEVELGVTFSVDEMARANSLITRISGRIQRYCNLVGLAQIEDDEIVLQGTYSASLRLPKPPVQSVSAVTVDGVAVSDYELAKNTLIRTRGASVQQSNLPPLPAVGHWGGPDVEVGVTYTHGLTETPPEIVDACTSLAIRAWSNPTAARSLTIDGYSAAWSDNSIALPSDVREDLKGWHRSSGALVAT